MRRPKAISESHEAVSIHQWLGELSRSHLILIRRHAQVFEDVVGKSLRPFAIESTNESDTFLAGDVPGTNLLRGVVRGAADAEFDVGREVMKVIDLIVDRV